MGLDMYLQARKYISGYSTREIGDNDYEEILAFAGLEKSDIHSEASPSAYITIDVAYWRKVNHVHSWFVSNVQNGEDDCKSYWVNTSSLFKLKDVCQQVLDDHSKAQELLPTQSGFFFGGTDYDEYYFESLENTIEMLNSILDNPKFADDWDFYYHSSW